MKFTAYLTAFHRPEVDGETPRERTVFLSKDEVLNASEPEGLLGEIFRLGQNDFQPREGCYSLSVGDVIKLDGAHWRIMGAGFRKMDPSEPLIPSSS